MLVGRPKQPAEAYRRCPLLAEKSRSSKQLEGQFPECIAKLGSKVSKDHGVCDDRPPQLQWRQRPAVDGNPQAKV